MSTLTPKASCQALIVSLLLLLSPLTAFSNAPHLAEWTAGPGELGLGYPVPIPVDTPLPFDGFRTYNGLRARHFELSSSTDVVHRRIIGNSYSGANINAWQLGDLDLINKEGLPEAAMLTNAGLHAREWQPPEVATGIMELLASKEADTGFYRYLLDNLNILVIPVLNVDGFKQTQRFPEQNWLQTDPDSPNSAPRDGRMRRKNMRDVDTNINTQSDHLDGVDLNRNNSPFWATSSRSSANNDSLVYHGTAASSESETQALAAVVEYAPANRLRLYTDMHSFTQVHFWHHTGDARLAANTVAVLQLFSDFQRGFPAAKDYLFNSPFNQSQGVGIGATAEYFAQTYGIPSWTLEVEPSGGNHPGLPGCGADYGGLATNCHDGFILPEAEIRRVRETLAETFAIAYYKQAGPAAVRRVRIIDTATNATVYAADWTVDSPVSRELHASQLENLIPGREYKLWVAFNKPMRWRDEQGNVVPLQAFPGQSGPASLLLGIALGIDGNDLSLSISNLQWLNQKGLAPDGYLDYSDDAYSVNFSIDDTQENRLLIDSGKDFIFRQTIGDITATVIDANPATVADWSDGGWTGLENSAGDAGDFGGIDSTLKFTVSNTASAPSMLIDASMTGAWPDYSQDKQGFLLEILDSNRAVIYWFTYDDEGNQRYLNSVGTIEGNRIVFADLLETRGGSFTNAGLSPEIFSVGSAEIIFTGCNSGRMDYNVDSRPGHLDISRLTNLLGYNCSNPDPGPISANASLSGAWTNIANGNHGLVLEVLADSRVVAYWFTYNNAGKQRWYFGVGRVEAEELVFDTLYTTAGGLFGKPAERAPAELIPWGEMRMQMQCVDGVLSFDASTGGMGSGQFNLNRLTFIQGSTCATE